MKPTPRLLAALLLTTAALAQQVPDQRDTTMQNIVASMAAHHHGKVALYAKHLRTGNTVELDADVSVSTASVIKVPILVESMYQVKAGKVSLDDLLSLKKDDQVSGSGVLWLFRAPAQINFETGLTLMITQSDNTATNLVLDHIGRDNVNKRLQSMGLPITMAIKKISKPADWDRPPEIKKFGIGRTTAREMAKIMESIERCDLGDPALCKKMIGMFENQFWRNSIPHYLEDVDTTEVPSHIANKTGSLDEVRNDVGIVFTKDGPIVISAFTYDNKDQTWTPENEAELLIARLAKVIVEGWAPHGLGDVPK